MPEIKYSELINMAVCNVKAGKYESAVGNADVAIRHNRFLFEAHFIKGCALFFLNETAKAKDEFNAALCYAPNSEDCIFALCATAIKCKSYDFHKYAEKYPDNAGIVMLDAVALYESGRKEEATEQFKRCHDMRPNYAAAYVDEGVVLLEDGKYIEAIARFDKAVELAPLNKFALYNRARACLKAGMPQKAETDISALLIINRNDMGFLFLSAEIDEALDRRNEAIRKYSILSECKDKYVAKESRKKLEEMQR